MASTLQRASWLLPIVDSGIDEAEEVQTIFLSSSYFDSISQVDYFDGMCCANLRNVIWRLFEDPNSSKAARVKIFSLSIDGCFFSKDLRQSWQVLVIVSSLFLFTSIIMLILSTLPEFQVSSWSSNKLLQN